MRFLLFEDIFKLEFELSSVVASAGSILLIVVLGLIVSRVVRRFISSSVERRMARINDMSDDAKKRRGDTVTQTLNKIANLAIWTVVLITILSDLGVNVGPIIAGLGIGGLALAFAAQHIIRDYLHGFLIITEDWYRVGEAARIGGQAGLVTEINLRTTVLRDGDGVKHLIPNGQITGASNLTREFARINFNVEVGYGEDLDRVTAVINEEGQKLMDDPDWTDELLTVPAVVRVDNLGASGVELKIMGDTMPMARVKAMGELRKRIKMRFDVEGIEIPWPHTKVFFGNSPNDVK